MIRTSIVSALVAAFCTISNAEVTLKPVISDFDRPVWAGMPKQSNDKLWVMEQAGKIWIVDLTTGKRSTKPFLDITKKVTRKGNEQGLLGLAFAPDFMSSGRYYINYNDKKDHTCIVRFVSKDLRTTEPDSGEMLMRYDQSFRNHNGGWISFGPDGMLYIGNGDGGAGNDPENCGQRLDTYLGKILRIDVSPKTHYNIPKDNPFLDKDDIKPEIWAYGVRNPWRCSFDRKTGDFWIADVGQNKWEEINFMPKGKGAGANYGWRLREGLIKTPAKPKKEVGGKRPKNNVDPVYVYAHGSGPTEGLSATGGYVYRGSIPSLQGRYIFADYQMPRIWSFKLKEDKASDFQNHSEAWKPANGGFNLISSFAEDNDGEIYVVSLSGTIYKIVSN